MVGDPVSFLSSRSGKRPTPAVDRTIDTYQMANLSSFTTGLPLTVWVSPRGRARHDARIKVSLTPGKMDVDNVAVVSIRPEPAALTPGLGTEVLEQITRWIKLNDAALLEYWDETIDTGQLIARLRKI